MFLIGPMGSGKSAVGRQLAQMRGCEFYDTDQEIEQRTGVDIPFIFEKEGEEGFRKREQTVLEELTRLRDIVLATGGGVVIEAANRSHLAGRGTVVYLRASIEQQLERTRRGRERPLLTGRDPEQALTSLMQERESLYQEIADIHVETDGRRVKAVATEINQRLRKV